tara:strand:+ start:814 stop:1134 length:321 start_codon:yes stop_codon:yes gene_type:complete
MKYNVQLLSKENDLNKILSQQKISKKNMSILFISEWDKWCSRLVEELKSKYGEDEDGEKLYVVNSFDMPHSFVIYGSTKVPHLVRLKKGRVRSEFYLPNIYKQLKV